MTATRSALEAAIDVLHVPQRADQDAGAGEQHERERHLGGDERTARAPAAAAPAFASAFLQVLADGSLRRLQRRHEPGEECGDDRERQREQQHASIDRDRTRRAEWRRRRRG